MSEYSRTRSDYEWRSLSDDNARLIEESKFTTPTTSRELRLAEERDAARADADSRTRADEVQGERR